ncbi:MAG: hypothetical protein GTN81_11840 [Proteobacteria bacterium]|nr:hypothetical protein [Pseudomonadota bacterium]
MNDRKMVFCVFVFLMVLFQPAIAQERNIVQTEHVVVVFEKTFGRAAEELLEVYGLVRTELEGALTWPVSFRPTIVLVNEREVFEHMAGSDLTVAFAIPEKKLIVIDYSSVTRRPFSLRTILKHELSHLLLHDQIRGGNLPKWLDEGVSQWLSDGIAEIMMDGQRSILREAVLSGTYLRLEELEEGFPTDRRSLLLAYEESRSLVEFIGSEFGTKGITNILEHLKEGDTIDVAIDKSLSISLYDLEKRWHHHLQKWPTWIIYLTANLYVILFFLAALVTVLAFIKVMIKKRRIRQDRDDYPLIH